MAIRLIGFDLDDTLWAMRPTLINAESKLDEWLSHSCRNLAYDVAGMRVFGRELIEIEPELAADVSEFRRRTIERALVESGYDKLNARELSEQAFDVFLDARNQVSFFDGALQSLASLCAEYSLAALTNGNADIERLGLAQYFAFALSAADVGAPKPAPDLFLAAMDRAQITAAEMVYIGDHPVHDIEAANALGMHTIWLDMNTREYSVSSPPSATINSLHELPAAIQRLAIAHRVSSA